MLNFLLILCFLSIFNNIFITVETKYEINSKIAFVDYENSL
jgi:hypothetical protein